MRRRRRRWAPWEQAGSSSQSGDGLGVQEGAYLEVAPQECRVMAVSAAVRRGRLRLGGGDLGEEEGGDPSALGEGGEACLCDEMLPEGGQTKTEGAHLGYIQY